MNVTSPFLTVLTAIALRLFPLVLLISRTASETTTLPGSRGTARIPVPKDTKVVFNTFVLHRSPDLFGDDADKFRPERWEEGQKDEYAYLPFGHGPRVCPGRMYPHSGFSEAAIDLQQEYWLLEKQNICYAGFYSHSAPSSH